MKKTEMKQSIISGALVRAYAISRARSLIYRLILRMEGGQFLSKTLRIILQRYHGVEAGDYSYGEGLIPGSFPAGVRIGRYVSIASGVKVFLRNHPVERLSMHPFFFNHFLGVVDKDNVPFNDLEIGHDSWIGANAIITPTCNRIGVGAVIAGGAAVTKEVPDFAIVGGVPAKILRYRFDNDEDRETILKSRWWEKPITELEKTLPLFLSPFSGEVTLATCINKRSM